MIMHLSAPTGSSVNNGINKEEYTLRQSIKDDAISYCKIYNNTIYCELHKGRQNFDPVTE